MVRQVARPPRGYQETNRNERERLGIEELEWEVKSHIRRYEKNVTVAFLIVSSDQILCFVIKVKEHY